MRDYVTEILEERVDPADILHLVSEMGKLRDEGREPDWYSQVGILADRFPRGSIKPMAIMERMQAFLPMLKDKRARGWSFDSVEPGCTMTHEAMFRGAALAPLHARKSRKTRAGQSDRTRLSFKRDEFFAIVLEQTDGDGPLS